jgi:hypothetical protein
MRNLMSFEEFVVNEATKSDDQGFNPQKETDSTEFSTSGLTPGKAYLVKSGDSEMPCIYQGNTDGKHIFNPEGKVEGETTQPCEFTDAELATAMKAGEVKEA